MAIYDANDNILMRFEYADSRLPVAMQSGGNTFYLAYDQVGSLRIVTDAAGAVIKTLDYDSFGNLIQDTNPSFDMPFGFAGGLYDPDTGLVRFGFREYSPEIGTQERCQALTIELIKSTLPYCFVYCQGLTPFLLQISHPSEQKVVSVSVVAIPIDFIMTYRITLTQVIMP